MGFFKDLKSRVRGMQNQMQPPMSPQMPPPFMRRNQAPGTVLDLETGLPPVRLPEITRNIGNSVRRLPQIMPERRMPQQGPSNRFFGGGLGSIFSRLPDQRGRERMSPPLPRAPLPMPQDMPRERFPMMRPGFATGEEVDTNMLIAEQAARKGESGVEGRIDSIKKYMKETGRSISDRDAQLYGIGEINLGDLIDREFTFPSQFDSPPGSYGYVPRIYKDPFTGENMDLNVEAGGPGISPSEMTAQRTKEFLGETGRTVSDRDAELYGMGVLTLDDIMERAEPITNRNLEQQEQMFFPNSGRTISNMDMNSLDDMLADLEKKN